MINVSVVSERCVLMHQVRGSSIPQSEAEHIVQGNRSPDRPEGGREVSCPRGAISLKRCIVRDAGYLDLRQRFVRSY